MPVTTNHTITVSINGVDKSSLLLKDSVYIKLQQNSKANVAELKFKNYDPPERSTVLITINGTTVFGGYVVRKSATLQGVKGSAVAVWSCECKDWAELLDTVKVTNQYTTQSDRIIINSLFNTFLFDADFDTTTDVATLDSAIDISFTDVSMTEALNQLAKQVGASWYIKPDKKLYWYNKNTGTSASFGISSTPNESTTFGFLNNSLSYEIDSSTIVNQVKIIGGVTSNGEKIIDESNVGNGSTKTFSLGEIPNSIAYVGWTTVTGTYTSYGSFVGYAPQDKLRSQGGNYLVVCDQNARTISMEDSAGNAPSNLTTVAIHYYKKELVASTYDDLVSQSMFGVYPVTIENKEFTSVEASQQLATQILEQNAYGKATIKFDTTKYGLLPGQLVQIDIAELEVYAGWVNNLLLKEDGDYLLLENGDFILLESYATGKTFLVQDVSLQPVLTNTNEYMMVCQVTAGKYIPNLIDALATVSELKSSTSINSQTGIPTRLSNISADLGEVQIGRAVFTDGGTARYQWGTPNYATGVVLGLEDTTALQGAMYIYDAGTVRVKLGNLNDMPTLGTVTPSGWGIYTENGFFKGVVYASQLIGGTVTGGTISGGYISGGTVTGAYVSGGTIEGGTIFAPRIVGGTISSGVIETNTLNGNTLTANSITSGTITGNSIKGNQIVGGTITGTRIAGGSIVGNTIIGGTIATGTPPINSSNPGVVMDATGLYGYGSAGLTFRLASDPAIKPYFSSGTIENATYEVTTQAVIRTGTTDPKVQIDNSGIFAYNSGGTLKFSVDSATGLLTASGATISGTVSASKFTGGTVEAGTITGNQIVGGTISGNLFSAGTVSAGTVTGAFISGGTVQGGNGTAVLNTTGLEFTLSSGTAFANEPTLKWKRSSTNAALFGGRYDGSNDYLWGEAGVAGSKRGVFHVETFGPTADTYNYYEQHDQAYNFWEVKAGNIQLIQSLTHDEIAVYKSLVPYNTYTTVNLGTTTTGYRYLYMRDSSNVIWRIEVNTSGSIVVTAA